MLITVQINDTSKLPVSFEKLAAFCCVKAVGGYVKADPCGSEVWLVGSRDMPALAFVIPVAIISFAWSCLSRGVIVPIVVDPISDWSISAGVKTLPFSRATLRGGAKLYWPWFMQMKKRRNNNSKKPKQNISDLNLDQHIFHWSLLLNENSWMRQIIDVIKKVAKTYEGSLLWQIDLS